MTTICGQQALFLGAGVLYWMHRDSLPCSSVMITYFDFLSFLFLFGVGQVDWETVSFICIQKYQVPIAVRILRLLETIEQVERRKRSLEGILSALSLTWPHLGMTPDTIDLFCPPKGHTGLSIWNLVSKTLKKRL
uniref:Uncharacterized protein n=1 Tax=Molossus molossus TaxID=27622 RepID=A0A7J8JWA9_MOLMO|nr:hypothetical protein HJG59_007816 [Molossus molossus]